MNTRIISLLFFSLLPVSVFAETKSFTLSEAVEYGVENSLEIQQLQAALRAAEADLNSAFYALYVPGLSLGGSAAFVDADSFTDSSLDVSDSYGLDLDASKVIFAGNALKTAYEMAELSYNLATAELLDAKNSLRFDIASDFYSLLLLDERISLMNEILEQLLATSETAQVQYQYGWISEYNYLQIYIQYLNYLPTLTTLSNSKDTASMALAQSIGMENYSDAEFIGSLWDATNYRFEDCMCEDYENQLLSNDFDLATLRSSLKTLELSQKLTEAEKLPTVSAFFNYSLDYSVPTLSTGGDMEWGDNWSGGLSVSMPLDSLTPWSSTAEDLKSSEASIDELELTIESTEDLLLLGLQTQLMSISANDANLSAQEENLEVYELGRDIAREQFDYGAISSSELTESEVDYQDAMTTYLETVYDYIDSVLGLYEMIGYTDFME